MANTVLPDALGYTYSLLHEVFELPELQNDQSAYLDDCRNRLVDLLSRALSSGALGSSVRAVQLVTRSAGGVADLHTSVVLRKSAQDTDESIEEVARAFQAMNANLLATGKSLHTRIRKNRVRHGVMVVFPDKADAPTEMVKQPGMHSLTIRRNKTTWKCSEQQALPSPIITRHTSYLEIALFKAPLNKSQQPSQIAELAPRPNSAPWSVRLAPSTVRNSATRGEHADSAALNQLQNDLKYDWEYAAAIQPLLALGPVVVCAPAVFRPGENAQVDPHLVFDAGLTLLLDPGTELVQDAIQLSQIAIVSEEVAMISSALTGMVPYVQQLSREKTTHEALNAIAHSIGNRSARLADTYPECARDLHLQRIISQGAAAYASSKPSLILGYTKSQTFSQALSWQASGFKGESLSNTLIETIWSGKRELLLNANEIQNMSPDARLVCAVEELMVNLNKRNPDHLRGSVTLRRGLLPQSVSIYVDGWFFPEHREGITGALAHLCADSAHIAVKGLRVVLMMLESLLASASEVHYYFGSPDAAEETVSDFSFRRLQIRIHDMHGSSENSNEPQPFRFVASEFSGLHLLTP